MRDTRHEIETGPLDEATFRESGLDQEFSLNHASLISDAKPPKLRSDRYEIVELIRTGGMGLVYRARDLMLHRDVALKVLRQDRMKSSQSVTDFTNEANVMSFLSHPGVTPIYETGTCEDQRPFHVMKLVDGVTLRELISRGHAKMAELLNVFIDVCNTMAFAHSRGVIHLDLKPANIMVGAFGEVNVMDWGLAQHLRHIPPSDATIQQNSNTHEEESLPAEIAIRELVTRRTQINGTPQYMSPEQARGSSLDERADVFSLGGILCEILSGHAPYEGDSLRQVYHCAVRGKTFLSLERLRTCGLDDALVRLAINCLQIEVRNRPANAQILAQVMLAHQTATLRSVQSDMNRFFELSPDMFCIADTNGFFVRINDNFSKVLGFPNEELLSKPFLSFVHRDDVESTIARVAALKQGQNVVRFRNRYVTASGDYVTLEWTSKAIEGEHLIFAVARDVT